MSKNLISVVIPALNEEEHLGNLLSDLKRQTYKKFEVIVVDDISSDRTVEIAKKMGAKVIISGKHNLSYSRNLGIKKSKGKIIVNLDADFRINKTFLEGMAECFKDREVQGVIVREILEQDTLTERLDYLRTFYKSGGYALAVRMFRKGIVSYDKDLNCFGEDVMINKKLEKMNKKIVRCEKALIRHHRFHSFKEVYVSWKIYPSFFIYLRKYERKNMWKGFLPLLFPFASPFITIHRLIKFKDPIALLIPIYDTVRAVAYIAGMPKYLRRVLWA